MSVLNRRLFNRGGRVMSSRGVGITSGLVNQPVQKFDKGGEASNRVDRYNTYLDELRSMDVVQERQPFNKFQNIAPAALDFFGGLMSGKSMQGGLGGGLEIAGESLKSSSPLFAQALKNKQEYDATDPEAAIKNLALTKAFEKPETIDPIVMKAGESLLQYNPDTGQYEKKYETQSIEKDKKLYTVNPNVKLVDGDGTLVAQGVDNTISKLYTLNPGEALYDDKGEQITYLPNPNDEVIKLKPGEIAYSSDGETILAENKTDTNKIIKLKPGETAFSSTGEVIAQLDAKEKLELKYATLSPGEEYYDSNGKLIARGSTVEETLNAFHSDKTGDERLLKAISLYESRMKLLENGEFDLESLNAVDRADYLRKLMLVDPGAKEDAKNWSDFVATIREDVGFIEDYSTQLELAQATFNKNSGTGPVRGAIKPVFDVFMDISGVNIPAIANKLFPGRDILLDPVEGTEMVRLQNAVAIAMQETIKGNASNFEQQMLLKSLFSIYKNPQANALAFENMKYINDLKKQRVLFAETSNNYAEMDAKIKKWKTENKPSMLKNNDEILIELGNTYGINFGDYGALPFPEGKDATIVPVDIE
jgi:hypothetical protein